MNSLYRAIYSGRDAQVFAIPPPDYGAMRRMTGSSTVTSHSLDATAVAATAEAAAQIFAGGGAVNFFEVYFAQKLCHRRRGTVGRKGRRTTFKADIPADLLQGLQLTFTADYNAISARLTDRGRLDTTTETSQNVLNNPRSILYTVS